VRSQGSVVGGELRGGAAGSQGHGQSADAQSGGDYVSSAKHFHVQIVPASGEGWRRELSADAKTPHRQLFANQTSIVKTVPPIPPIAHMKLPEFS
jgi:hypothetical protein